jgi:YVTN family beta-propeller protein
MSSHGSRNRMFPAIWAAVLVATSPSSTSALPAEAPADPGRRVVRDGVAIDFSVERVEGGPVVEGEVAEVRFRMTDAASGSPVPGLKPAAWMDMAGVVGGKPGQDRACKDKVALYLQGSVGIRPMIDLNSYYLVLMNKDASLSVVDPVVSMTGNTSLYASVALKRPGADWARSRDGRRLFVTMPRAGEVAVVDTETFRLLASVPTGPEPLRVALQPDGRLLWVATDAREPSESGVTVLDAASLAEVARIATGRGHHEIAFSADGVSAFVTNREEGTVSVVDVGTLRKVADLPTGPLPIAVATSSLSQSVYVADGRTGTLSVVDPARREVTSRIAARPGLGPMRFTQDGRFLLSVNPGERALHVVDASENRLVHTIPLDGKPYQVGVTRGFAYVRLLDSPQVKMVNLGSLGAGKTPIVQGFGAGTSVPADGGELVIADAVTQAALEAAVFVSNPGDGNTYFYMEGMNAPMGSYGGYGHRVVASTVVDRSLREVAPGVYSAKARIPVSGRYDVAFLLDNPRVLHCFSADAAPNPAMRRAGEVTASFVDFPSRAATGARVPVRLRVVDPVTGSPRDGIDGVRVVYHAVPGGPRTEAVALARGDGVYEALATVDRPGAWYFFAAIPSLKVNTGDVPFRGLVVEAPREPHP